jgi:two-component system cell cycle response regulator
MQPSILLVDDEELMLSVLEITLASHYRVLRARDGNEALSVLDKETIHLVISDLIMPGIDGFELCKRIKSKIEYAQIPVILLTASHSAESKIEGFELGADAYIQKPFDEKILLAQIASLLYNRNKVREFFIQSPLAFVYSTDRSKYEEAFMSKLEQTITRHLEDHELDVEKLAGLMAMSRITLYRKVKSLSDCSPAELITIARLRKGAELLSKGDDRIYEIADKVGFSSSGSFSRNFLRQYNMTPTEYLQKKRNS